MGSLQSRMVQLDDGWMSVHLWGTWWLSTGARSSACISARTGSCCRFVVTSQQWGRQCFCIPQWQWVPWLQRLKRQGGRMCHARLLSSAHHMFPSSPAHSVAGIMLVGFYGDSVPLGWKLRHQKNARCLSCSQKLSATTSRCAPSIFSVCSFVL